MKASVQYNDLTGTVAADSSDFMTHDHNFEAFAEHFNLNTDRFKIVGISIYGTETDDMYASLICVDKEKSTEEKEHIVKLYIGEEHKNILKTMFKRLEIVLYNQHDTKYPSLDYDQEGSISDFN